MVEIHTHARDVKEGMSRANISPKGRVRNMHGKTLRLFGLILALIPQLYLTGCGGADKVSR